MKKIVAINCSPRTGWNTATLVREAAQGAEDQGAEVRVIDLYALEKFTGCVSCFGCKLPQSLGRCICRDGLAPVLEEIRNADGLIPGTASKGSLTAENAPGFAAGGLLHFRGHRGRYPNSRHPLPGTGLSRSWRSCRSRRIRW